MTKIVIIMEPRIVLDLTIWKAYINLIMMEFGIYIINIMNKEYL